jgi:hypothetical protein
VAFAKTERDYLMLGAMAFLILSVGLVEVTV